MAKLTPARAYVLLTSLASTEEAGSLAKERAVLLLWFLRNSVGIDDLDAYDYICDADLDGGVDALYLELSPADDDYETLVIYQSKYTTSASGKVGENDVKQLVATANRFRDAQSLNAFIAGKVEPRLKALIADFDLVKKLEDGKLASGGLRIRLELVASGSLTPGAKREVDAANAVHGPGYFLVHDLTALGALAQTVASPERLQAEVVVPGTSQDWLIVGTKPSRVAIAAVRATDIVQWPGIDDRSLFVMNVRRELRPNKVSAGLDGAIRRHSDHKDFLAYHNGLTVVCDDIEEMAAGLRATKPSVVNGAQSVIALMRGFRAGELTPELRVFVKFVEVAQRPQLAKEVSRRSNTQTAVNPRNLVALSGPQRRLESEFATWYPNIAYETRPDASNPPSATQVIANDDAAQLLCAVINAMPWLAVKRLTLFESENHAMIFKSSMTAHHIVMVDLIGKAIDAEKASFPDAYRSSWKLTRLVAAYLVGQILRAGRDDGLMELLDDPGTALADRAAVEAQLRGFARLAAATLKARRVALEADDSPDDFKAEFKNEERLRALGKEAQHNYVLTKAMAS
jgi:hypothetical protein